MKLELKEFMDATRAMHERSGVKKTKLMLHLRPYHKKHTFQLKSTDGQVIFTSRVIHQGQLKMLESFINQFVLKCTSAVMQPAQSSVNFANNANTNTITSIKNATNTNTNISNIKDNKVANTNVQQLKKNEKAQQQQQQKEKNAKQTSTTTNNSNNSTNKRGGGGGGGGGHHKKGQRK